MNHELATAIKARAIKSIFDKHWYWLALNMACPSFLIAGQNISFFILLSLIFRFSISHQIWQYRSVLQIICVFFGLGAVISTFGVVNNTLFYDNAKTVLPNYLYWQVISWVIIGAAPSLNFKIIAKGIFHGLTLYMVLFFLNINTKKGIFINPTSPNSFSLVVITYIGPAMYYVYTHHKKMVSYSFLGLAIFILVNSGRRAGTLLTSFSALSSILLPQLRVQTLTIGLTILSVLILFASSEVGEEIILNANPRIHELIFETDKVIEEDRSYLTRRLMIEKGLMIFEEEPLTGIGLNNFKNYKVNFQGDFQGSEFIIDKDTNNELSSHNSYIAILAEGGLFLLVPFLFIIAFILITFLRTYGNNSGLFNSFYFSAVAMSIHLYFITGIVNVYVWFMIALIGALSTRN